MNKDDISLALKRPLLDGTRFNELIAKPTGQSKQLDQGNTFYTVQVIKTWSQTFFKQVIKLAKVLQKDSLEATCVNVHSFLYNHLQYQADGALQNLRSPANSWHNRKEGIDCKSYSIFASCILTNLGIKHYIRQIKQAGFNPENFSHVYVVVPKDQTTANLENGYYTIDGTLKKTSEPSFITKEDVFMSKLEHMGLNGVVNRFSVKKVKSNKFKGDERYIIIVNGKEHLDGQPFYLDQANMIITALRFVNKKKPVTKKATTKKKTGLMFFN